MEFYSKSFSNPRLQQGSYIAAKQPQSRPSSANAKLRQHCPFCDSRNHTAANCTTYTTAKPRSEQARKRQLCYNCLSTRHNTRDCKSKFRCRVCSRKHHTSLCTSVKSTPPNLPKAFTRQDNHHPRHPTPPPARNHADHFDVTHMSCNDNQPISIDELANSSATVPEEKGNNSTFTTTEATNQPAPLMCTDVKLFNPDDPSCCATATAFLDCGSTATYITEELAALLNLPTIKREELSVSTFAGSKPMLMECSIHKIGTVTENGTKCLTVKSTSSSAKDVMQIIPDANLSVTLCKPSIPIGNDYFWDLVLSHNFYYKNLSEGHRLLHTTIGDIILKKALDTKFKHCSFVSIENDDVANPANHNELCELVSRFWKLESVGILDNPDQRDDDECLKLFNNTIYYDSDEKRYVVTLPFKVDPVKVPDNYTLAYSRLRNQLKQLQQNPSYLERYHAVIEDQLQRGIIERVPAEDVHKPCHYLSHHGELKRNDKDLKIRLTVPTKPNHLSLHSCSIWIGLFPISTRRHHTLPPFHHGHYYFATYHP
ncbi:unnamed protein product [Cylicocyclus nassatus]|uniref:CCHC-type domain-containing protein n=1 Tax=Cylicocyclus nassatus TaxID=53992 RepID=A0AA36M6P5_CYLNA|nr:unnamed protein product [Cylicocyclus nassatus]